MKVFAKLDGGYLDWNTRIRFFFLSCHYTYLFLVGALLARDKGLKSFFWKSTCSCLYLCGHQPAQFTPSLSSATQRVWQKTRSTHSDSKRMIPVFNPNPHRFIGAFPCVHPVFFFFLLPILLFNPQAGTYKGFTGFSSRLLAPAAQLHILLWDSKDLHPRVAVFQQRRWAIRARLRNKLFSEV